MPNAKSDLARGLAPSLSFIANDFGALVGATLRIIWTLIGLEVLLRSSSKRLPMCFGAYLRYAAPIVHEPGEVL